MRLSLQVIILGFVLVGTVSAEEKQFIDSWKKYDEQIMSYDDARLHYRRKMELSFGFLREYEGRISRPGAIEGEIGTAFVLYSQKNATILLVTPKNIMKNVKTFNEEYKQTMRTCAEDKSWIVVLPQNEWSTIDLNPYCTMDYDEQQITIDLYWADSSSRPFIDVVTSSLSCVPHHLYGWDRSMHKYALKSRKCTGSRSVESYTATEWRLLPLLPPGQQP